MWFGICVQGHVAILWTSARLLNALYFVNVYVFLFCEKLVNECF